MWLLARILPLSIGDLVPEDDERWLNFLKMLDIVDILFCPRISEDDAAYLATLIGASLSEPHMISQTVIVSVHLSVHLSVCPTYVHIPYICVF